MKGNHFWLQKIVWIYDHKISVYIISLALALFTTLWTALNALGVPGSIWLFVILVLLDVICIHVIRLVSRSLRWHILFKAIKDFIGTQRLLETLSQQKVLVGIGPGGAIAVGLVAKAVRELGRTPPLTIAIDMSYSDVGVDPKIGTLFPPDFTLPADICWIIQGNVTSGRSLRVFREKFSLYNSKVFSFIISENMDIREKIDYYMAIGTRNFLPWPTEQPELEK